MGKKLDFTQLNFKLKNKPLDHIKHKENNKDIAIVGIGLRIADLENIDDLWNDLVTGRENIGTVSYKRQQDILDYLHFIDKNDVDIAQFPKGCYLNNIDEFDYRFFKMTPKESALMSPVQRLLLQTTWEAIEDAGYSEEAIRSTNTGVYLGMIGDVGSNAYRQMVEDVEDSSFLQLGVTGNLVSIIPGRISYLLDLKGPSMVIDTACSSSLVALHTACNAINNNDCNQAIVAGVNLNILPIGDDVKIGIESKSNQTRPFSDWADGTVVGEGVVSLLIKPYERALEDNDHIYAIIKSTAVNQDGNSMGITAPNAKAQEKMLMKAWKKAGISPEQLTYIEAHGTGTILGDPIEIEGIKEAFNKYTNKKQICGIGSIKGNVGHLYGAAGLASVLKCLAIIQNKAIPPHINFDIPNSRIAFENSPVYINDTLEHIDAKSEDIICGVSAFGFSGTNCHVVLQGVKQRSSVENKHTLIFTLSASSEEQLYDLMREYNTFMEKENTINYQDVCFTSCVGRKHHQYRMACVVSSKEELVHNIKLLKETDIHSEEVKKVWYTYSLDSQNHAAIQDESSINEVLSQNIDDFIQGNAQDLLDRVCKVYVNGGSIEWEVIFRHLDVQRVILPKQHFKRDRCWIEINKDMKHVTLVGNVETNYSDIEYKLAVICKQVLGIKEVDVNENLLETGGDSILVTKLHQKIEEQFPNAVTLPQLFVYPTVKKLAEVIEGKMNVTTSHNQEITPITDEKQELDDELTDLFNLLEDDNCDMDALLEQFKDM